MRKPTLVQAIVMLIVAIIVAVTFVSCHKNDVELNEFTYTVSQGETLWEITEEYCPKNMDCWEYLYEVKKINNMKTSELAVGQTITLLTTEQDFYEGDLR